MSTSPHQIISHVGGASDLSRGDFAPRPRLRTTLMVHRTPYRALFSCVERVYYQCVTNLLRILFHTKATDSHQPKVMIQT